LQEEEMKESTDRLIQRVAILAMLVIVAFTAYRVLDVKARAGAPRPAYSVGEQIDIPTDLIIPARATVVVFARSTCGACQAYKPFAAKLVKDVVGVRPHVAVQLMAVSGARESELKLADEIGVPRQNVRTYDKWARTRLLSVPTTMVVDPLYGKILYVHEGVLNDAELDKIGKVLDSQALHE
jgi:thiol-disulfide isomerase/thioredoxin